MKGSLVKVLAVTALVAGIGAPTAAARPRARVRLSILPLPKSALGPAAKGLALEHDSGVLVNGTGNLVGELFVGSGLPVTPNGSFGHGSPSGAGIAKLGRITGYALDYGLGASGGTGVTEVRTSVDEYKTSTDAKKSLPLWKAADRSVTGYGRGGLSVAIKKTKVPHVGSQRFAFLVRYSASNIAPLFGFDEQFTQGRYEADVTVWAGTAAAAKRLAPRLAKKLHTRIERALAGRLHAKPVKLSPKQKPGLAPGGPDLSALALKLTDLGQAKPFVYAHRFWVGRPLSLFAVSEFYANMIPAGKFAAFGQEIQWFATANQASFEADWDAALFGSYSLDLSSVGDGARAELANDGSGYAEVVFSSGRLEELVVLNSNTAIRASDVQNLARTVASRLNAAGLGS